MKEILQFGFTFIEVLIVIVFIGLLSSICIPIYNKYILSARKSACLSEVKNYSNNVFYTLNEQSDSVVTFEPDIKNCNSITNANGWTLKNQRKIIARLKLPSTAIIECDIPNGASCVVIP